MYKVKDGVLINSFYTHPQIRYCSFLKGGFDPLTLFLKVFISSDQNHAKKIY